MHRKTGIEEFPMHRSDGTYEGCEAVYSFMLRLRVVKRHQTCDGKVIQCQRDAKELVGEVM